MQDLRVSQESDSVDYRFVDRVIAVLGPTATGKTDLGVRLAEELGGDIINADALQVYRGLDLGTAKPSRAIRDRVRHHLIDILDPRERFSAGEFARRARSVIDQLHQEKKVPILVGGSGLYLRALLEGISPIPRDEEISRQLAERCEREGLESLRRELEQADPESAARLARLDRQRILRALEVVLATGKPISDWIRLRPFGQQRLPAFRIGLTLPRAILYDRIARRVEWMVDQGWVNEVSAMLDRGYDPDCPGFQAIGYRQIVRHLMGHWSLGEAVEDTIRATRRYAKRQMTWFRKEQDVRWVQASDLPRTIPSLLQELKS